MEQRLETQPKDISLEAFGLPGLLII